jgi:hypothetical protein
MRGKHRMAVHEPAASVAGMIGRGRHARLAAPLALIALLAVPAAASATWSAPMRVPLSKEALWPATAVNARGDAAVAWIQEGRDRGRATVRVRAAVRRAGAASFSVRTLVARRDLAARGAAVALDARGELTVAWIEQASDAGRTHGHKTVWAAYRTAAGRWSPKQAVGRSAAFNFATPRLAATPGGTVALSYNGRAPAGRGVVAAWRTRGRAFGRLQSVPTGGQYLAEPTLAFDPAGRAFLTGTQGCFGGTGGVAVFIAPPGRRRFTARASATTASGKGVRMAVMGRDSIALTWLTGTCNTTEDLGGAPYATTVRDGVAASPAALANGPAMSLIASPGPGGAELSFTAMATMPRLMTSRVTADGGVGTAADADWIALAGDPAGDQLIGRPDPVGGAVTPLAARTATGETEPAPLPAVGFPWTAGTVAAHDGRALAVLSFRPLSSIKPSIVLSVWRPAS